MPSNRIILCRPEGGLNDIFSQIERICRYAEITQRLVIVDTAHAGSVSFLDDFSNYFSSRQKKLYLSLAKIQERIDFRPDEIFPRFLESSWNTYKAEWDDNKFRFVEASSKLNLALNLSRAYPQKMVIHHGSGKNDFSHMIFLRMHLKKSLIHLLDERLKRINGPYLAIHIRNTDYQTDYKSKLFELSRKLTSKIFVATDNADTLRDCKAILGSHRVISFSKIPEKGGKPIHYGHLPTDDIFQLNCDAILDLFTLALARHLFIFQINKSKYSPNSNYSGYSLLANQLHQNKPLLSMAIGEPTQEILKHLHSL